MTGVWPKVSGDCHRCLKLHPETKPRRAKHVAPDFYDGEGLCGPCAEEVELEMRATSGETERA